MTLTLELTPELKKTIEARAQQSGQSVQEYAAVALREKAAMPLPTKPRRKATGHGKFAYLGHSVDDFLEGRRQEAEQEMDQAEERDNLRRVRNGSS